MVPLLWVTDLGVSAEERVKRGEGGRNQRMEKWKNNTLAPYSHKTI